MSELSLRYKLSVLRGFWGLRQAVDAGLESSLSRNAAMSMADFRVLEELKDNGERRVSELAEAVVWEKSRLSHHLARMELRGLVERVPAAGDKRGVLVRVTSAGRSAYDEAFPVYLDFVSSAILEGTDQLDFVWMEDLINRLSPLLNQVREQVEDN